MEEDYVSFEVAKLLKEKGFNERTICYYFLNGEIRQSMADAPWNNGVMEPIMICAPTLQMAMKWLREVHKILITIVPQEVNVGIDRMCYAIYRITEDLYQPLYNGKVDNLVDSYEEAVETALKYALENLI